MSNDYIQANYEELDKLAQRFRQRAEATQQLSATLKQVSGRLIGGSWEGKGSEAFAAEMNRAIFPAMKRLENALSQGDATVSKIKQTMVTAEGEAAALFKSDGVGTLASLGATMGAFGGALGGIAAFGGSGSGTPAPPAPPTGPNSSGPLHIGPPTRPPIKHDNGFLDKFKSRDPDMGDRINLLKWRAKLEGAEAFRPGLADGTAAYRHFLDGDGKDRQFNYERYVTNDASGKKMLQNIIRDAQKNVEVIGQGRTQFSVSSDGYSVGGDARFPYPDSENWQKAIGGHTAWSSADVTVSGTPPNRTFSMNITVHAEDRYNFNPGQSDVATGIPDSDNGVFEITGLAHQYTQYGQVSRTVTWTEGNIPAATITDEDTSRNRRPGDNRRARNRI